MKLVSPCEEQICSWWEGKVTLLSNSEIKQAFAISYISFKFVILQLLKIHVKDRAIYLYEQVENNKEEITKWLERIINIVQLATFQRNISFCSTS